MATLIDNGLVALVLLASVLYALLALGPKRWRRAIRGALGFKQAAEKPAGTCGGCEGCSTEAGAPASSAEINIPVGKIGRR